jgi:hypothetical protein
MIKIKAQVVPPSPEGEWSTDLTVPSLPRKGDYFELRKDGELIPAYKVTCVYFVEEKGGRCSIRVLLEEPPEDD